MEGTFYSATQAIHIPQTAAVLVLLNDLLGIYAYALTTWHTGHVPRDLQVVRSPIFCRFSKIFAKLKVKVMNVCVA